MMTNEFKGSPVWAGKFPAIFVSIGSVLNALSLSQNPRERQRPVSLMM